MEKLEQLTRSQDRPRGAPLALALGLSLLIWAGVVAFIGVVLLG